MPTSRARQQFLSSQAQPQQVQPPGQQILQGLTGGDNPLLRILMSLLQQTGLSGMQQPGIANLGTNPRGLGMPAFQYGGVVQQTGPALVHEDETVLTPEQLEGIARQLGLSVEELQQRLGITGSSLPAVASTPGAVGTGSQPGFGTDPRGAPMPPAPSLSPSAQTVPPPAQQGGGLGGALSMLAQLFANDPRFRGGIETLATAAIGGGGRKGARNIAALQGAQEQAAQGRERQFQRGLQTREAERAEKRLGLEEEELELKKTADVRAGKAEARLSREDAVTRASDFALSGISWAELPDDIKSVIPAGRYRSIAKKVSRADELDQLGIKLARVQVEEAETGLDIKKFTQSVRVAETKILAKIYSDTPTTPTVDIFSQETRELLGDDFLQGLIAQAVEAKEIRGFEKAKLEGSIGVAAAQEALAQMQAKAAGTKIIKNADGSETIIDIETGEAIAIGGSGIGSIRATPQIARELRAAATDLKALRKLQEMFQPGFTGPLQNWWDTLRQEYPVLPDVSPEKAEFRAANFKIIADTLKRLAGTAQSEQEKKNILAALANLQDKPVTFEKKLELGIEMAENLLRDQVGIFSNLSLEMFDLAEGSGALTGFEKFNELDDGALVTIIESRPGTPEAQEAFAILERRQQQGLQ